MSLICPNCSSNDISYTRSTTIDDAYDATGQRYTCRKCGYVGSIAIEGGGDAEVVNHSHFPYLPILLIGLISTAALALGTGILYSAGFFLVFSAATIIAHYLMRPDEQVENDLKNLDNYGRKLSER